MLEWDKSNGKSKYCLDNILKITNEEKLREVEYKITLAKTAEIFKKKIFHADRLNLTTLKEIHKHLFKDVYGWAGEIRDIDIWKGDAEFARARFLTKNLEIYFEDLSKDNYLKGLSKENFVELLTYYTNELNMLHPFREGNGRTKRIYMSILCEQAGWQLNYDKLDKNNLMLADIMALGDQYGGKPDRTYMKHIFMQNIKPIENHPEQIKYNEELKSREPENFNSQLNEFLWIHKRYDAHKYMDSFRNMKSAENYVKRVTEDPNSDINLLLNPLKSIIKYTGDQLVSEKAEEYVDKLMTRDFTMSSKNTFLSKRQACSEVDFNKEFIDSGELIK